ncbi:MAG: hypothetical protein A3F83_04255 [Candidatus Glassbacteria bacterium RIFCSPLOWO2_12_FULL_58_11]|uniref:Uncharacterized protein n=2 Tax=Candidatus Glassiibacteriota TaxID=1817805 RepID=A0A1F5YTC6_9BACT|nr:MAG: hypothetical protein A2Z86_01250 [Candidatus Glassbacteria bacterium GWA2_58_10]OGG03217.1 MAG: hypothetical protein A3F83_04255 [Candidatus Glassbacteria bacterium RIFCSPLOWO2_12_FULL_58_11]
MKLTLDGKSVRSSQFSNAGTLAELIRSLELKIAPERVIISMTLDGRALDQQSEKDKAGLPLGKLGSLEILTENVSSLARNTLATLCDYLPELSEAVEESVLLLQGSDESQGHRGLEILIDGIQMASQAWKGIACFIKIEGRGPDEVLPDISAFNEVLMMIAAAQENGDIVQICDLLEFELKPLLESWSKHAAELHSEMLNPAA